MIASFTNYIRLSQLYELVLFNCTFSDITDDRSNDRITLLFNIVTVNLEQQGSFLLDSLTITNTSLSLLTLSSFYGNTDTQKVIRFSNIYMSDTVYITRNNFITFGPLLSTQNVSVSMNELDFRDLEFTNIANIIDVNMQLPNPLIIDSCRFINITGGYINLRALSTASGASPAAVEMTNVTVLDSDFKFSTFFVLRQFCQLSVRNCTLNRNSGYFRGTIASILGKDSYATFNNCRMNNNNGIVGGLFYVTTRSSIEVVNSTLFSNYAVEAAIGYVGNQGRIILDTCEIYRNKAVTVALLEIVDSTSESSIVNSRIYSNTMVQKEVTLKEVEDPTICIDLCFASNGFISFLRVNQSVLDTQVRNTN